MRCYTIDMHIYIYIYDIYIYIYNTLRFYVLVDRGYLLNSILLLYDIHIYIYVLCPTTHIT